MVRKRYYGYAMPEEMKNDIQKTINENPELGYKSISEFIKDSVRRRIENIYQNRKEKKKTRKKR